MIYVSVNVNKIVLIIANDCGVMIPLPLPLPYNLQRRDNKLDVCQGYSPGLYFSSIALWKYAAENFCKHQVFIKLGINFGVFASFPQKVISSNFI